MKYIKTLEQVLDILNANKICFGVGGSYLLQMYDLCESVNDIDFWVEPNDMQKVRDLFKDCEEIVEKIQLPQEYHYKFRYLDIEIDFVACFITRPNKNEFVYNIKPERIEIITTSEGVEIPCTSLEDWYIVYKLLNRKEKAKLIEKYIYKRDVGKTTQRLYSFIEDRQNILPKRITNEIKSFIWDNLQMTLEEFYNIGERNDERGNV